MPKQRLPKLVKKEIQNEHEILKTTLERGNNQDIQSLAPVLERLVPFMSSTFMHFMCAFTVSQSNVNWC